MLRRELRSSCALVLVELLLVVLLLFDPVRAKVTTSISQFFFRERYDLLAWRREYFEPPLQKLLAITRTARFRERAESFGGYDVSGLGTVRWNGR